MKELLFHFHNSGICVDNDDYQLIYIPTGIGEKQELLQFIADSMKFPPYFGFNWDALDECLADLSWLKTPLIGIWHEDIPLASNRDEAHHYIEVLDEVLREPGSVSLRISFPEKVRNEVQALLT